MTGTSATASVRVREKLTATYRPAYDILVRPPGSFTSFERQAGLVRANYLAGLYGGITLRQFEAIRSVPGVSVAAPIANIGTVLLSARVSLDLGPLLGKESVQVFRVHFGWRSDNGLSRYPGGNAYLVFSRPPFPPALAQRVCSGLGGFAASIPSASSPFSPLLESSLSCATAGHRSDDAGSAPVVSYVFRFPVQLAAIDPLEEAKLVGLDRAVVRGRNLRNTDGYRVTLGEDRAVVVPVLASTRVFIADRLDASVERLVSSSPAKLFAGLSSGACQVAQVPCPPGESVAPGESGLTAYQFASRLRGVIVARRSFSARHVYRDLLRGAKSGGAFGFNAIWIGSQVRYKSRGRGLLQALPTTNSEGIWQDVFNAQQPYFPAPAASADTQFRRLHEEPGVNRFRGPNGFLRIPRLALVGDFDPSRLRGFSPLTRVPLETYYPPELTPATPGAARALRGRPLLPSQNIGGYIQQPPLLLTTLSAVGAFTDRRAFSAVPPRLRLAPIASVRVRVADVHGMDALSRARISAVAQAIRARTGLDIDITAGSSPTQLEVLVPAGRFGRPALTLNEAWTRKGASVTYARAVDDKDLALFVLVVVICILFVANATYARMAARRREIGVELAVGWSRGEVTRAALLEVAIIGLLAGVISLLAIALVRASSLAAVPLNAIGYAIPMALLVALLGGVVPAARASSLEPLQALSPPVRLPRRAVGVSGTPTLALANLIRAPLRAFVGGCGLLIAVAALTVLLEIQGEFHGSVVATVLGRAIAVQTRSADYVAAGLVLSLGAISAADVLYLNLRERNAELVTALASGWSLGELRELLLIEGGLLAVASVALGLIGGLISGSVFFRVGFRWALEAGGTIGAIAIVLAAATSVVPVSSLARLAVPEVLAAE